jgi:uncharacterized protein (DUF1697 family)
MAVGAHLVALLRAVNVGGRSLLMADLKAALERLGFAGARTLLQSGNAVFSANGRHTPTRIEQLLERDLRSHLALESTVFVRTQTEWHDIVASNPFRDEAKIDPAHLVVMLLKSTPAPAAVERLQSAIKGREIVGAGERRLYAFYPDGLGRSKLTNSVIERTLKVSGTARNWNTVVKLAALLSSW